MTVLDVDESLIAVNKFLATTDPVTSAAAALTAKAQENAAAFVFTAALTSRPFSAVRLEVKGDVDAFASISVDGADGTNRSVEPADWASAVAVRVQGRRRRRPLRRPQLLRMVRGALGRCQLRRPTLGYDDVPSHRGLHVAFATVSGKTLTVGAGVDGPTFSDGYWITLSAPPTANVVVSLDCADTNVFRRSGSCLRRTTGIRKYVAVNASLADPNVLEGRTATLTHSVASADAFFDGLAVSSARDRRRILGG